MMIQILLSNMTNQLIKHPKQKIELEYSGLVGPEHAVFFRGHAKNKNTIRLPEHWRGLIDETTITVHLTPFGASQSVFVKGIQDYVISLRSSGPIPINCYYMVMAVRKDVPPLEVVQES